MLRRVRARRLLPAAALLAVVLTTCVLATLAAFSTAIADAGLRHTLTHRSAAPAALRVTSDQPLTTGAARADADRAVAGAPAPRSTDCR
ncbi:hypothetical protein NKH77_18670 [Streptomyces sp. M19]